MYLILLFMVSLPLVPILIGSLCVLKGCRKGYKENIAEGKKGTGNLIGIIISSIFLAIPVISYTIFFIFWALDGFTLSMM